MTVDTESSSRLCQCGCDRTLPSGSRPQRRYFAGSCRERARYGRAKADAIDIANLEHEELVVSLIGDGTLEPADGILWILFPDRMRAACAYRVEHEAVAA